MQRLRSTIVVEIWFLVFALFLSVQQSSCWAQTCPVEQTPSDALGPFYLANSPTTELIGAVSDPNMLLEVKGRVLSTKNCKLGLANVTVEVWYAGEPDENGNFYRDDDFRGKVITNSCGEYSFVQSFPALYPARPILHDHFRLSRDNQELLVTQMYFQGDQPGYTDDSRNHELQVVDITQNNTGVRSVEFNIYVDLEGDNECTSTSSTPTTSAPTNSATPSPTAASPTDSSTTSPTSAPIEAPTTSPPTRETNTSEDTDNQVDSTISSERYTSNADPVRSTFLIAGIALCCLMKLVR